MQNLLDVSAILDIETFGLGRGSAIHQIALKTLKNKELTQWYVDPGQNLLVVNPATNQDVTKLASSPYDIIGRHKGLEELQASRALSSGAKLNYQDVATAQTLLSQNARERIAERLGVSPASLDVSKGNVPWGEVLHDLRRNKDFLHSTLTEGKFPYLQGKQDLSDKELERILKDKGGDISKLTTLTGTIEDILFNKDSALLRQLKGKAIWIANAEFESKQLGAQMAIREQAVREQAKVELWSDRRLQKTLQEVNPLRSMIAGSSTTISDILTPTGKEVIQARYAARMTGDWSPVFRAIMENTGAGDVRDIIDVIRAQQSFSEKLGLIKKSGHLSMDVQARLYAYSTARDREGARGALSLVESHIAREDVALTEERVLRGSLSQTEALEQVHLGTARGRELIDLAKQRQGPLYDALRYASVLEHFGPQLEEQALSQRLGRMYQDFAEKGHTVQFTGYTPASRRQFTPEGEYLRVTTPRATRTEMHSITDAIEYISGRPEYSGAESQKVIQDVQERVLATGAIEEGAGGLGIRNKALLETTGGQIYEESRQGVQKIFADATLDDKVLSRLEGGVRVPGNVTFKKAYARTIDESMKISGAKWFGMGAAGLAAAGAFKALWDGPRNQREGPESLRTMNYEKWLSMQAQHGGLDNSHMQRDRKNPNIWEVTGLSKGGMGHAFRSQMSDFGSPYIGPVYSGGVFAQFALLDEREKYLRESYGARHFDPAGDVGGMLHRNLYSKGGDPYTHPIHWAKQVLLGNRASASNHGFMPGTGMHQVQGKNYAGLRNKNFLEIDLSNGDWKMEVEDADTVVVKRRGVVGALSSFFGGNSGYKFRLSGIDAPETEHQGGAGYHKAQPYANASTLAAKQMVENARNLKIVVDPKNITYGRMVGTVFADDKNLNLEFIKRGMASYLPFKKKGTEEMYQASSYEAASKMAMASDRGMWKTPFFSAYKDLVQQSGKTITFNTLTQIDKISANASLMNIASVMHNAQSHGFYNTAMATEMASISADVSVNRKVNGKQMYLGMEEYRSQNWRDIHTFNAPTAPHKNYMTQMVGELSQLIKTQGSSEINRLASSKVGSLDKSLSISSTQAGTIENRRRMHLTKVLGVGRSNKDFSNVSQAHGLNAQTNLIGNQIRKEQRMEEMAALQRQANYAVFTGGSKHHQF